MISNGPDYLNFSLVFESEPVGLLEDGLLVRFGQDALAYLADFEATVYTTQDHDGRIVQRKRKQIRGDELALDGEIQYAAMDIMVLAVNDILPLFSVVARNRTVLEQLTHTAAWGVHLDAFDEQWFVEHVLAQIDVLVTEGECYGFGGLNYEFSGAGLSSPLYRFVEQFDWIDYRSSIAGVHWINVVPTDLISEGIRVGLESIGVSVRDGNGVTVVQLTELPSQITDELVGECMGVCSEIMSPLINVASLPSDWWRQGRFPTT